MPVVVPYRAAEPRAPLNHVFILGAGFSKAINETMPTLLPLGGTIADYLKARPSLRLLPKAAQEALERGSIPGGDLETWLSNLASPAPFVSDAEAHFNAGIFSEITGIIGDEIDEKELEVLGTEPPPWLARLVRIWNAVGATVITFNYDTLIEHAARLISPTGDQWPNVGFRLLKVHGSTHWWRQRGDTGPTVDATALLPGWGVPDAPRVAVGDERVLVPPVAAKGSYYEPGFIRRQWQDARLAVEGATKLVVAGYRLPANDLATTTLISQHLAGDAEIVLVNLNPVEPEQVLKSIGRPARNHIPGRGCVEAMVGVYEQEVGMELLPVFVKKVGEIADDPPIDVITADPDPLRAIIDIKEESNQLVLIASDRSFRWEDEQTAVHVSALRGMLAAVAKKDRARVVIRRNGVDHPAFAFSVRDLPVRWAHFEG